MKTLRCAPPLLAAVVSLLLTGRASAASFVPLLGPVLTYSLVTLPQPTPGLETIEFGLSGYVFTPAGLASLTPAQLSRYTIISFGETGFESQGGVVDFAYGITPASGASRGDLNWSETSDFTLQAHFLTPSVPDDPLPPSDPLPPLNFLVGVSTPLPTVNGQAVQLFNQPFTLTNQDGTTETIHAIPYVTPAVPEPTPLALLGAGLVGLICVTGRRRRKW